jgi:hypothetical protein
MFPTAVAHIVDMPRAAPRLMSIASPDSVSGWSCPSPGEAQNITRDAQNITFSQPCVMSSLYTPNTYIWYSKKRRKQLPPKRGQLPPRIWEKGRNRLIWKVQ